MRVKLLEPIEGYEDVAEYKYPTNGQPVLREHGSVDVFDRAIHNFCCCLVLTPIKLWRPATIDDAVRALRGETVIARFRDSKADNWQENRLCGCLGRGDWPWVAVDNIFKYCEVLDA